MRVAPRGVVEVRMDLSNVMEACVPFGGIMAVRVTPRGVTWRHAWTS